MNKMIVKNERKEKLCCFYVSEFHLEMILVPYINKKIQENENITIFTEIKLKKTVEELISKMNLKEEEKQEILKLEWNGDRETKENSNILIIGTEKYIKEKNEKIKDINTLSIVDCYDFEDIKNDLNNVVKEYKNTLNTLGKNNF